MWIAEKGQQLLNLLEDLSYRQAAILILVVGLVVHITGLTNPFQGDDFLQIVNNPPVHSISNVATFFQGSTFSNGGNLTGSYYRPLMTTTFSVIYTVFGKATFGYHLIQLSLVIAAAFLLFWILRRLLNSQSLAILLSLLFLAHPINSQVAFSIPSMQDALFFFFGCLGLYFVMRKESKRDTLWALLAFFASMLSKETGVLFVLMAWIYLFIWERNRLLRFAAWSAAPVIVWFALRVNAVSLFNNPNNAPIDRLPLGERLLTTPSIIEAYLSRLIFPWHLSSAYYWVHRTFSVGGVGIPLILDAVALLLVVGGGYAVKRVASEQLFRTYLFFSAWFLAGFVTVLQIAPLDMTFCETWFYFSTAGLMGMLGVLALSYGKKLRMEWFAVIIVILVVVFGTRTIARGTDWSSTQKLDEKNIAVSHDNYVAYNDLSHIYLVKQQYSTAAQYARKSITIFPYFGNYNNLGAALLSSGDFKGARDAFDRGLGGRYVELYRNMAHLDLFDGTQSSNSLFFAKAVKEFPRDGEVRLYKALFEAKYGNNEQAKEDVTTAAQLGYNVPAPIYNAILEDQPLTLQTNLGNIVLNPSR